MILLDTNVIIRIIHKTLIFDDLKSRVSVEEKFGVSAISLYEIYFGLYQLKYNKKETLNRQKWDLEKNAIRLVEDNLEIIPFDARSAEKSSKLFNLLRSQGRMIQAFDCMIAGNMKAFDISKIITSNLNHFSLIPDIDVIEL